ncbi:MAG: extracellular solute-binding protein [Thermoprotei archaeon]|nr:extracellular solute-binding protein [Thermoprotei archaeon]
MAFPQRALIAAALIIIVILIAGVYLAFIRAPPTPTTPLTPTPTTPITPTPTPTPTPSPTPPAMPLLTIGVSKIRVPQDFYDLAMKAKRGEIKVTINLWTSMLPFEVTAIKRAVDKFKEEYPGIEVRYTGTVANMKEAVKAGIIAGDVENTAHVFTWAHDWTGEMADGGYIVSLSKIFPKETLEDLKREYAAYAYSSGVYKLELYGLPWAAEAIALICNLDMTGGSMPSKFSELEGLMKRWYKPEAKTYGLAWQMDPYHIYPLVTAFGGFYYDEDRDAVGVNSAGTVEAFKFLLGRVFPYMYTGDLGHEAQLTIFEEGRAPCIVTGPWNIPRIKEKVKNIAIGPIPEIDGMKSRPFSGVKLLWVTKAAEHDRNRLYASILFALWFTLNDDILKMLMDEAGFIPVKVSVIDYMRADPKKYPIVLGFAMSLADSVPMPKSLKMAKVWGPVAEALSALITTYNEKGRDAAVDSVKPALDEAQKKILEAFRG